MKFNYYEFVECKLSELLDIKYGKNHKHLAEGTIPVYGSGGLMRYAEKPLYEKESILIPRKGSLNNIYYMDKPFWTVDTMFYSKIQSNVVGKFLYFYLKTIDFASMNVGSAVPSMTIEILKNLEIPLPNLKTQTRIAAILSSLDDKIELNRQMNATLEAMAQTLFQEMCLPKAGESMEGEKQVLFDICKLIGGGTPKTSVKEYWENGTVDWISAKDLTPNHGSFIIQTEKKITELGLKRSSAKLLPALATVISARGTVGNVCIISKPMTISQSNYALKATIPNSDYYLFHVVINLLNELKQRVSGTIFDTITTSTLSDIEIHVPKASILMKFNEIVAPIFQQIKTNIEETQTLTMLRESLLPKLMRGELLV